MGGFFGVASKKDCVFDLFFGTDYHSHLGTRRAGMAVYNKEAGFERAIHNIENAPFRTKFDKDVNEMQGYLGIGCISDYEPQPLLVRSHHGTYAIMTVGKINNMDAIVEELFSSGHSHFLEMSGGDINATELVAAIINQKDNLIEGLQYVQEVIDGSMTVALLTPKGIYASRDRLGRTPVVVGKKEDAYCISFESFAYLNLGYVDEKELGPGEIVIVTPESVTTLVSPGKDMKICTFLGNEFSVYCISAVFSRHESRSCIDIAYQNHVGKGDLRSSTGAAGFDVYFNALVCRQFLGKTGTRRNLCTIHLNFSAVLLNRVVKGKGCCCRLLICNCQCGFMGCIAACSTCAGSCADNARTIGRPSIICVACKTQSNVLVS